MFADEDAALVAGADQADLDRVIGESGVGVAVVGRGRQRDGRTGSETRLAGSGAASDCSGSWAICPAACRKFFSPAVFSSGVKLIAMKRSKN